tara:strand:- start:182 stop:385 length:204 start_codon:yes stop_codon:yes gene_type:complete
MELPITRKDLDTIVQALALGGDARLYHLLKDFRNDNKVTNKTYDTHGNVQVYSESDEYQCKHGTCDI